MPTTEQDLNLHPTLKSTLKPTLKATLKPTLKPTLIPQDDQRRGPRPYLDDIEREPELLQRRVPISVDLEKSRKKWGGGGGGGKGGKKLGEMGEGNIGRRRPQAERGRLFRGREAGRLKF
jgi:hypothetical protein